jgi:hypothetical protein
LRLFFARVAPECLRAAASSMLLATLPALALHAHARDPMASPECSAARAELEQAENDGTAGRARPGDRVTLAREKAASACLGGTDGQRERSGAPDPAQRVPPPVIGGVAPVPPALRGAAPQAPLEIPRHATITTCDPAGCWDSEGRRLNQTGPLLMGPRGVCIVQGGIVTCP